MSRQTTQQKLVGTLLVGGLVVWGGLQAVPLLVDQADLKQSIEKGLRDAIGVNLHIKQLSLQPTLFHNLQVHLNTNTITDDRNHPLGAIRNISIEIRYLPIILSRTPEIAKIHLRNVDVPIRDYSLFKSLKIKTTPPPETGFIKPVKLRDTEILLSDYRITDYRPDKTAAQLLEYSLRKALDGPSIPVMAFRVSGKSLSIQHLESDRNLVLIGVGDLDFLNPGILDAGISQASISSQEALIWHGTFDTEAELAALALKEGHAISASDLKKLKLALQGQLSLKLQKLALRKPDSTSLDDQAAAASHLDFKADYSQHGNGLMNTNWFASGKAADGKVQIRNSSLAHVQALLLQLANIASISAPLPARSILLSGPVGGDIDFQMDFNKTTQPFKKLEGFLLFNHIAVAPNASMPIPSVNAVQGKITLDNDRILTDGYDANSHLKTSTALPDFRFPLEAAAEAAIASGNVRNPTRNELSPTEMSSAQDLLTPSHKHSGLAFTVAGLPLRLNALYELTRNRMDIRLNGDNLTLSALNDAGSKLGSSVGQDAFAHREIKGSLDIGAHLWGTVADPRYEGAVQLGQGVFADDELGVRLSGIAAEAFLRGAGTGKQARVSYQGNVRANQGKIQGPFLASSTSQSSIRQWAIDTLNGSVRFQGQWRGTDLKPAPPVCYGTMTFSGGHAVAAPGLKADKIQGAVRLDGETVSLQNASSQISGAMVQATANARTDLSRYSAHVWGHNLPLPQIANLAIDNLPPKTLPPDSLRFDTGRGDFDINASGSGMKALPKIQGRATATNLGLSVPKSRRTLKTPKLALVFDQRSLSLSPATLTYQSLESGENNLPVQVRMGGKAVFAKNLQYNFDVASQDIPMTILRDLQPLAVAFSGVDIPEVWNTSGSMDLKGTVSNAANRIHLTFNDAGLSWQGGDFPLYGLTGALQVIQKPHISPSVTTNQLSFVYGRSPFKVEAHNENLFSFNTSGILSALTVNHYLVSRQSEATPYHDIPFRIQAQGKRLEFAENAPDKNDIAVGMRLDLGRMVTGASQEINASEKELPPKAEQGEKPLSEKVKKPKKKALDYVNPINIAQGTVDLSLGVVKKTLGGVNTVARTLVETVTGGGNQEEEAAAPGAKAIKTPAQAEQEKNTAEEPTIRTARNVAFARSFRRNNRPKGGDEAEQLQKTAEQEVPKTQQQPEDKNAFLDTSVRWRQGNLDIERVMLHLFDAGDLLADGKILHPINPSSMQYQLHAWTPSPIGLKKLGRATDEDGLFRHADGNVGIDMRFAQAASSPAPQVNGYVEAQDVVIPTLTLRKANARVDVAGQSALAVIGPLTLPGIDIANAKAKIENFTESPMTLNNVVIQARLLDMAGIANFNNRVFKPILIDRIAHSYLRPWQLGDPILPVQFRNASLSSDELIYQNILMSNLKSRLSVYANGFCELNDTDIEAAGGKAGGYLSMNANDNNFTTLDLKVDQVKANALTKALLNVTNQIFGDISGNVRFTTFGPDDNAMQKNANGTVSMKITNGRLPAIAKVETLLTTANVLRGGVLGLNLNNIFRTLTIYDTNYFATLSGDMVIANQVLYTRNLISDGINLDLLIRGSLKMDSGEANMLVNGDMSQNVQGKLGAIGNLSLAKVVRFIPGLGTFGKNQAGLFGYLPGLGYVPGLGGPAGETNKFQVRLKGLLESPGAIQDFRWVRNSNAPGPPRVLPQPAKK